MGDLDAQLLLAGIHAPHRGESRLRIRQPGGRDEQTVLATKASSVRQRKLGVNLVQRLAGRGVEDEDQPVVIGDENLGAVGRAIHGRSPGGEAHERATQGLDERLGGGFLRERDEGEGENSERGASEHPGRVPLASDS